MEPEAQMMAQAVAGGPPLPVAPAQPSPTQGLSPEALAALFLAPSFTTQNYKAVPIRAGESGFYDIMHDSGKMVGHTHLKYDPDQKQVKVEYIQSLGPKTQVGDKEIGWKPAVTGNSAAKPLNDWAHTLGTGEVKSLIKALAKTFPEAETVTGQRVSGAKLVGSTSPFITMKLPRSQGVGGAMGAPGQKLTDLW